MEDGNSKEKIVSASQNLTLSTNSAASNPTVEGHQQSILILAEPQSVLARSTSPHHISTTAQISTTSGQSAMLSSGHGNAGGLGMHNVNVSNLTTSVSSTVSHNLPGNISNVTPMSLHQGAITTTPSSISAQAQNVCVSLTAPNLMSLHPGSPLTASTTGSSSHSVPVNISGTPSVPLSVSGGGGVGPAITITPGSVPISMASAARTLTSLPTGTVAFRSINSNQTQPQVSGQDSGDESVPLSVHVPNSLTCSGSTEQSSGTAASDQNVHQSSSQSEQRLKVEDALNYLDQVKYKFGNQPQVYNDFLDIMKEFKSQSIDTPGVIQRVSQLFRGHPELIVGFNTFLPPGYKIEVQTNNQVSFSMIGHGGYVVQTTVSTGAVPNSPVLHPGPTSTSIIQHSISGHPIRSAVAVTPQSGTTGINNGRTSPIPPAPNLGATTNSFETSSTPAFTHSFTSPFVQSAFPSLQSQPVEFNHAINYVNKIKSRFQGQPDKYKQFLEILHTYQKEQRNIKEGLPQSSKHLTEHEVYSQVSKLFENQDDLLQEFGQFLPDATNHQNNTGNKSTVDSVKKAVKSPREFPVVTKPTPSGATKRPTLQQNTTATKKFRMSSFKDISLAEAGKYGSLNEFAFFDKVRQLLKAPDIYENFLRCLILHNDEILSLSELLQLVTPFLSKSPDLYAWFKDFIGLNDNGPTVYEPIPATIAKQEKLTEEQSMEIDFSTCKRLGASYCALPKNHVPPKCSGRTSLCHEVLNDVWVSFPTWSEDSTFITSRKTQFEEYIYRCEDERFELDVVIETNASTIRVLEMVAKKMSRMSQEELNEFELDECLGGSSPTIHQRAVRRLYGDKAGEIMDGLRKQPSTAVPLVLRRLKAKEEEWREAQKGFNKIWREQIERFYLKSLDHQGITFKQTDIRALRSKALISELETVFEERQEQQARMVDPDAGYSGPHLMFAHKDISILEDANNLLIHHVRRQSGIQKEDKRRIKQLLKQFIPDIFFHKRLEITEDEIDDYSPDELDGRKSPSESSSVPVQNGSRSVSKKNGASKKGNGSKADGSQLGLKKEADENAEGDCGSEHMSASSQPHESHESKRVLAKRDRKNHSVIDAIDIKLEDDDIEADRYRKRMTFVAACDADEAYTVMYVNTCWYVFLRLHFILCERLSKMREKAKQLLEEEMKDPTEKNSAASILRLRPKHDVDVEYYYPFFLELVRNLLDGNIEAGNYEDTLREMFGIHAYIAYTLDKVVANAVRQLQSLVGDESCQRCMELFIQSKRREGAGGLCATMHQRVAAELSYLKNAEKTFADDGCIKVVYFKKQSKITFELLENDPPPSSPSNENAKWAAYVERFVQPGDSGSDDLKRELSRRPVFLPRNIRNWKKRRQQKFQGELGIPRLPARGSSECPMEIDDDNIDNLSTPEIVSEIKKENDEDDKDYPTAPKLRKEGGPSVKSDPEDIDLDLMLNCRDENGKMTNDYIIQDNLQCQFNPNSYKMIFVVNSENFIYLKGALKTARKTHRAVSTRLSEAFGKWHANWIERCVSEEHITRCEDWLMGMNVHTTLTKVISNNDLKKPPYRPFNSRLFMEYVIKLSEDFNSNN
ncbi:unnamed protein product [Allacma fusca]|uniref:Paired amphipathic helix protein Sin3a n=1 Tax=Allacma fusca TaxID=39272 RepID=A0A8J2JVR4_9HEXA|nr:unnamed protein product [Allacma fusca]